jgi:hypothetical protein
MFKLFRSWLKELMLEPPKPTPPTGARANSPVIGPPPQDLSTAPAESPIEEPEEAPTAETGFPPSYLVLGDGRAARRSQVFDPSLKQYGRAFRHGEPRFDDFQEIDDWRSERRRVVDRLLETVAESRWRNHLVLRGSVLLKTWFGDEARSPGDVDWVVIPNDWKLTSRQSSELFAELTALFQRTQVDGVRILGDRIVTEDIWTYERAPGRRIIIPWEADGLPPGTVQMDFVFNEAFPDAPELIDYATCTGRTIKLFAVGKELSLIWKLIWLETDSYAQGKDLYDAVLLARRVTPRLELLIETLRAADHHNEKYLRYATFPLRWQIDWENFVTEYPDVRGTALEWQQELSTLLIPMFAQDAKGAS